MTMAFSTTIVLCWWKWAKTDAQVTSSEETVAGAHGRPQWVLYYRAHGGKETLSNQRDGTSYRGLHVVMRERTCVKPL